MLADLPIFKMFTISNNKTNEIVFLKNKSINEFYISFIHSVNKVPVEEYFKIENDKFLLYKTVFYSYGAGMPEFNEKHKVSVSNGLVTITDIDTYYDDFSIFSGTIANHKIVISGTEYPFEAFAKKGSSLKFEIKRISVMQMIAKK